MAIEETIERIAVSLEQIAEARTKLLEIAQWNKDRLIALAEKEGGKTPPAEEKDDLPGQSAENAVPEPKQTPAAAAMDYEQMKAALIGKGVTIPKGTKSATLEKWMKDPESIPAACRPESHEETAPSEAVVEAEAEAAPVEEHEAEEPAKIMTIAEAQDAVKAIGYDGLDYQKAILRKAIAFAGGERFADVAPENLCKIVAEYKRLAEEHNAGK